ncbi:MAG: pitrilysin family protein [Armatimonadota bacterium]
MNFKINKTINIITVFLMFAFLLVNISYSQKMPSKLKLANGAVILVKEDYKMDIVSINILFKAGLKQEEADTSGATNIVKSLLFKNSGILDQLEYLGAAYTVETNPDFFQIKCFTSRENFSKCLDLIYEGLTKPEFAPKDLEEVKARVLEALKDPYGSFATIYDYFLQNFYQNHPYKLIQLGTSTAVKNIDPVILNSFYERYFSPNNMVVSVCGNINKSTALKELGDKFSQMQPQKLGPTKIDWEPPSKENKIYLGLKSSLAWVLIGYPAPSFKSQDYPVMLLIKNYLSEGMSSKLWTEIREKEGLAYELGGIYPQLEGPSHLAIYVITEPNGSWISKRKMLNEVELLKKVPLDYGELNEVKEKTLNKLLLEHEMVASQAEDIALAELLELDYSFYERLRNRVIEITPDDIKRVANQYLVNPTIITAKPAMSIQDFF